MSSRAHVLAAARVAQFAHRDPHVEAAELRNHCRRKGVQVGTIDALFARLCIRHDLTMLTTSLDFSHIADHSALKLWGRS